MPADIVFDRIVITVADVASAVAQYRQLIGTEPFYTEGVASRSAAWWPLSNTVIELLEGDTDRPHIAGVVLGSSEAQADQLLVDNSLGLSISVGNGSGTAAMRRHLSDRPLPGLSVDHLVLRTGEAESCVALFRDELGIRLALDQTVPEWGGRMLFFRAGQLTLEVIQAEDDVDRGSFFWGIAYQCPDLEQAVTELVNRGVTVSGTREGRKPGTRVATVKSHCLGIPTLLIQPLT